MSSCVYFLNSRKARGAFEAYEKKIMLHERFPWIDVKQPVASRYLDYYCALCMIRLSSLSSSQIRIAGIAGY